MKDLLTLVVRGLVSRPDRVEVEDRIEEGVRVLSLGVAAEDRGRLIGRRGRTASALRTLVTAVSERRGEQWRLEIQG